MKYSDNFLETLKGKAKGKDVTPESALKDLGIDSLDLVELVLDAELEYGVTFTNDEWRISEDDAPTIISYSPLSRQKRWRETS